MNTHVWHHNKQGEFFIELGKRHWAQGQYEQAKTKFREAVREFSEAINILEPDPDTKKNPDAAWTYAHLADAQRLVGDVADAETNFDNAIDRSKGKNYPYVWAHRGEFYRTVFKTKEHFAKARECFTKAIEQSTSLDKESCYIWAYAHRGASYDFASASEQEFKAALKDLTLAINESGGTYAWALAFRSVVYMYLLSKKENDTWDYARNAWFDVINAKTLNPYIIGDTSSS
jgi:tetratricopeptide (TPR) repeat protein